jgi:hypothetical protein
MGFNLSKLLAEDIHHCLGGANTSACPGDMLFPIIFAFVLAIVGYYFLDKFASSLEKNLGNKNE